MTQRASESLVAVLIRIGLLLALVIMLMAENAQAQPLHSFTARPTHQPALANTRCRHSNEPVVVADWLVEQGEHMKFEKQLSSLMTAALLCGTFTTLRERPADAPAAA